MSFPNKKKRKHASAARSLEDKHEIGFGEVPKNHLVVPASVKIAALEALEVLLTVVSAAYMCTVAHIENSALIF